MYKTIRRHHIGILFLTVIMLAGILCSCSHQHQSTLNTSETFFDETLASISPDNTNPDIFYIGTEDGVVYVYNAATVTKHRLLTAFDRIYKVVRDSMPGSDSSVYWVGTRNMGVVRCSMRGDSLVMQRQYVLPVSSKGTEYSAYDLAPCNGGVYAATSHGLFFINASGDMVTVYSKTAPRKGTSPVLSPIVVSDIRKFADGSIACASNSGVLRVDTVKHSVSMLTHQRCNSISLCGDTIMALCGDTLKRMLPSGRCLGEIRLEHSANVLFHEPLSHMEYLVGSGMVQIVPTDAFCGGKRQHVAPTGRPVRTFCHNVIVDDPMRSQLILVTEHSLMLVGHHQDMFSDIGNVKYACGDGGFVYYLAGTRLFRQRLGDNRAVQIKDLLRGNADVRFMTVIGGKLYYSDSNNRVFKADLYSNYFLNSLFSWDRELDLGADNDITAIGHDSVAVYVGIRDGIRQIGSNRRVTLRDSDGSNLPSDGSAPFVTSFSLPSPQGDIFLGTLNDGIFCGKQGTFSRLSGTQSLQFVRDIAVAVSCSCGSDSLFVLTNHRLLRGTADGLVVSDTVSAMRRIAVADASHVYGFPDYGIVDFGKRTRYFADIHFNPKACIAIGGRVYAGSSCGVYTFGSEINRRGSAEVGYATVSFEKRTFFSLPNIILLIVVLIASTVVAWYWTNLRGAKRRMLARIDKLRKLGEMFSSMVDTDKTLDNITSKVKSLSLLTVMTNAAKIDTLNEEIQNITLRVPSVLNTVLGRQIATLRQMRWNGFEAIVAATEKAMELGATEKAMTAHKTEMWIEEARRQKAKYDFYMIMPDLEGVTKGVYDVMHPCQSSAKSRSLDEKLEMADRAFSVLNVEGIAARMVECLAMEQKNVEAWISDNTAFCDVDYRGTWQMRLLDVSREAVSGLVDDLRSVGDAPLPDTKGMLLRFANGMQRYWAAAAVFRAMLVIDGFIGMDLQKRNRNSIKEVRGNLADCVSAFYNAVDMCQDRVVLDAIGLSRKKDDGHFLNENLLVVMLAKVAGSKDSDGNESVCIGLGDDDLRCLLDAEVYSVRRSRRSFRNLMNCKLNATVGNEVAGVVSPYGFIEKYAQDNPGSFALLLVEALKGI